MENKTVGYDRLLDIFITFLDESSYDTDPEWVKEKLELICTEEELEELGLKEWIWGQNELDEDPYDELPEEGPELIDENIPDENEEELPFNSKNIIIKDEPEEEVVVDIKLSNDASLTYQVLYRKRNSSTFVGYTDDLGEALTYAHSKGIVDYCIFNQKEKIPVESK